MEQYKEIKEVKKAGNSGHVILPKKLIGKYVKVKEEEDKEE